MSTRAPVEAKVKAATISTFLASIALAFLNNVTANSSLLGPLPPWLQALIITVAPTLVTFLAGFTAPHTPRLTSTPAKPRSTGE